MARHRFVIHGKQYEVDVGARVGQTVQVTVNGRPYVVGLVASAAGASAAAPAPPARAAAAPAAAAGATPATPRPAAAPAPRPAAKPAARPSAAAVPGEVRAPIPGVVLDVAVAAGEAVTANTKLLVLEAMKMENEIFAGVDGKVATVHVEPQQEVRQGDLLVTIAVG